MSVFSDLKPKNHAVRNGFDLSRYSSFTAKVGPIIPVFSQLTLQGGDYSIDVSQLLRTQPLQTAAFAGFSINYDVVFTPLNHLFSSFNQYIAQRANKNSTNQPSKDNLPLFNLGEFLKVLIPLAVYDYMNSQFKQVDFNGYSQEMAKMPYHIFTSQHSPESSLSLDVIRALDMYGYGNFLPLVKMYFNALKLVFENTYQVDITTLDGLSFTYLQIFDLQSQASTLTVSQIFNILLGILDDDVDYRTIGTYESQFVNLDKNVTLWPALAYNKAFYEYYRNTYYDTDFILIMNQHGTSIPGEFAYVQLFNFDDWSNVYTQSFYNDLTDPESYFCRLLSIFALKPHLYKRDLFTGVLPSTQFGDVSVMTDSDIWNTLYVRTNNGSSSLKIDSVDVDVEGTLYNSIDSNVLQTNDGGYSAAPVQARLKSVISILEMRRADAMQRFKERMLRAGDKTPDIFKAHGWTEPRSEKNWEPMFLGSFDGRLDINTVTATSESGDFNVGQLAANGVGTVKGHRINFKNTDFGIIQIFFYLTKDAVYNSYGLNAQHCMTDVFDWPYPELQNISLAPINRGQLSVVSLDLQESSGSDISNEIIGYLPRFMQFKTANDEVHGEFYSAYPHNEILSNQQGTAIKHLVPDGIFANWVTARADVNNVKDLSFLYIQPSCADNIFVVNANSRQDTDQFIINAFFECKCVEPLTVIGLPI